MDEFDIVVTGLDPERDRAEVLRVLAQRLVKSADELELLLARAPSTLIRSVPAAEAAKLVTELRALGARVKPQEAAPEIAPDAPAEKIELLPWSAPEEVIEAPPPITEHTLSERPPLRVLDDAPSPIEVEVKDEPPPPSPIEVREEGAWHAPDSRSTSTAPSTPISPSVPPPPSPARFGRSDAKAREIEAAPFFRALPTALVLPLRRPRRLLLATALVAIAMLAAIFCLRSGTDIGPLLGATAVLAAVAGVGVTLQNSASCLTAARLGEREPPPMAARLMEDYLRPGLGVLVALALLATALGFVMPALADAHVSRTVRIAVLVLAAIYAVTGFVLSAARGSSLGYLDLLAIGRLAVRSPLRASIVTLPTTAVVIAAGFGVSVLLPRWVDAPMPELLVPVGIATSFALGAIYALGFSGAAMGTLLRAEK